MSESALSNTDDAALPAGSAAAELGQPARSGRFNLSTFKSLGYRDYRLLWIGTLFASSGLWIQQVTVGWLAYDLTGSGFLLGAVNGFRSLPMLFLAPVGGVMADRLDRKKLMLVTQAFMVALTALMAFIILSGQLAVWHLFAFTLLTGVAWAFNMPVRQSIVPNLVPPEALMNAVALNSAGFNITRIVGPSLAGIMIATLGAGENFVLQSIAYVGVAVMIVVMVVPAATRLSRSTTVRQNLLEGSKYVWGHKQLRPQMLLALVPVVLALPYQALLPVFATDVLHRGAGGFGVLMSAPGIGAVIGTLTIASMSGVKNKGKLMLVALMVLGLSLALFALSRSFVLSFGLLVIIGASQMMYMTTNQTLLQLTIPDELRGRVMGIYMLNQGLLPLGTLFAGALTDLIGASITVLGMGASVGLLAVLVALRSTEIRRA